MNDLKQDFLTYLEAERGYSPTTIATYKKALVSVEIFFKSIDSQLSWQTIDADVMRQWLAAQMERGEGARTMGKELSAVRSFYKYLRRMGVVDHNPMSLIQNPKAQKVLPSFLKEQEVERLFDDVDYGSDFVGVRNQTMLLTFYHTGVRMAELIGLNVNDIQLATCELRVMGKRNKQRVVPFGLELHEALVKYLHVRQQFYGSSEGPVFITQKRQRINRRQVGIIVKRYLSLVTTQKKKSPHVLRHTFATAMLNNGASLEAIRELLGHESISTTEVYTHTSFADLKKEYELAHPRA